MLLLTDSDVSWNYNDGNVVTYCRKSALAKSDPFEQLLLSHRETTTDKSRELEERREKLYSDLDPLVHTDRRNSDMIKVLESKLARCEIDL